MTHQAVSAKAEWRALLVVLHRGSHCCCRCRLGRGAALLLQRKRLCVCGGGGRGRRVVINVGRRIEVEGGGALPHFPFLTRSAVDAVATASLSLNTSHRPSLASTTNESLGWWWSVEGCQGVVEGETFQVQQRHTTREQVRAVSTHTHLCGTSGRRSTSGSHSTKREGSLKSRSPRDLW